jgi:hypothetical protein
MTRLQRLIGRLGSSLNLHISGDAYFVSFNFSGFAGWASRLSYRGLLQKQWPSEGMEIEGVLQVFPTEIIPHLITDSSISQFLMKLTPSSVSELEVI